MDLFFTRARFGRPQMLAAGLLLVLLLQCQWLALRSGHVPKPHYDAYDAKVMAGLAQWRGGPIAGVDFVNTGSVWAFPLQRYDPNHSPLWYLTASAPLVLVPDSLLPSLMEKNTLWRWLASLPSTLFGLMLGASVWYVARRLYGNPGGYIALAFYCFSPGIIRSSALWFRDAEMGAAWGSFGAVFTAIAVAHTLYAPREVVLWNWRRILLLGLSLALAVGYQFSLIVVVPVTLGFMLYVAPARMRATLAIWASACGFALLLLFASYFFHPRAFWLGMRNADLFPVTWRAFAVSSAYGQVFTGLGQSSPALLVALPVALVTYLAWPRARYFGNSAPLLMLALFLVLGLGTPHYSGLGFQLMAVPFLFVFIAGVSADLLETRQQALVAACLWGLLAANAVWNVWELARV